MAGLAYGNAMGAVTWGIPTPIVDLLRTTAGIRACVETGTFRGDSTEVLAGRFDRVITVEASPTLAAAAERRLRKFPNVQVRHGDSRTTLPAIVAELAEPTLFWLDSHYCGSETHGASRQCPVLEEIAAVVFAAPAHVLLIDDARLFLKPPPRPLDATQWPAIDEIVFAVAAGRHRRHVVIHDDVILAVPEPMRPAVMNWLVEQATVREAARHRGPIAASMRAVQRLFRPRPGSGRR